jgi:hypothetical protein
LLDKWLAVLPGAFTEADHAAGYRYESPTPLAGGPFRAENGAWLLADVVVP